MDSKFSSEIGGDCSNVLGNVRKVFRSISSHHTTPQMMGCHKKHSFTPDVRSLCTYVDKKLFLSFLTKKTIHAGFHCQLITGYLSFCEKEKKLRMLKS